MTKDDIKTQLENAKKSKKFYENKIERLIEESKKLELKAGYITYYDGSSKYVKYDLCIRIGICFPTKETSEIANKNRLERDRLEAYSRQIDPDWREIWDGMQENWFIQRGSDGKYNIWKHRYLKSLGTVYMSKETAERLCDALNNNEIEL